MPKVHSPQREHYEAWKQEAASEMNAWRRFLLNAIKEHPDPEIRDNLSEVARQLGVTRQHLQSWLVEGPNGYSTTVSFAVLHAIGRVLGINLRIQIKK